MTPDEQAKMRAFVHRLDEERRDLPRQLEHDVSLVRGLSDHERAVALGNVIRSGWRQLMAHPDRERIVRLVDPPAPDFDRIWKRLNARYRQQGRGAGGV